MKRIEVISLDRVGLIGEISNVIRRLNGDIISHTANVVTYGNTSISHFRADIRFETASDDTVRLKRLHRLKNVRQVRISDV